MERVLFVLQVQRQLLMDQDVQHVKIINNLLEANVFVLMDMLLMLIESVFSALVYQMVS
jgi:hypothetical protein